MQQDSDTSRSLAFGQSVAAAAPAHAAPPAFYSSSNEYAGDCVCGAVATCLFRCVGNRYACSLPPHYDTNLQEHHPAIRLSPATEVSKCDNFAAAFARRWQLELIRLFCSAPPPVWRLAARMLPRPLPCCSSLCVLAWNLFLSVCCSPTAAARLRR